ncbi:thiamine phosphate synthase [Bacillus sp. FJAT-47783]|uniref:thiamine phosphate synthase n=1 Tax=Bacillus sp. FJAT-47783 TaxID=2922712 RepID=UPI001FAB4B3F|nr:thiamine phosphate synthase [Bacillus sp. FJAT-47783]
MGSTNCTKDPYEVLKDAIRGGITMFQFREKGTGSLVGKEKIQLAKDLQQLCKQLQIPFIVNDDVELALQLDADGVHIGQEDGDISEVRAKIGHKILGISTHNVEEAKAALKAGADYIGVGPMYETNTKKDIREVKGPIVIQQIRESGVELPLVAIGGIHNGLLEPIIQAGADGVAVISAISKAKDNEMAAFELLDEYKRYSF